MQVLAQLQSNARSNYSFMAQLCDHSKRCRFRFRPNIIALLWFNHTADFTPESEPTLKRFCAFKILVGGPFISDFYPIPLNFPSRLGNRLRISQYEKPRHRQFLIDYQSSVEYNISVQSQV